MAKRSLNIQRFLERAELLEKSTFLKRDYNEFINELLSEDSVVANTAREVLESYVVRLRPFLDQSESVSIHRLLKSVMTTEIDPKTLELLQKVIAAFEIMRTQETIGIAPTNDHSQLLNPEKLFWYLVNGDYLHVDEEKKKTNESIDESFESLRLLLAVSHAHSFGNNVLFTAAVFRREIVGQSLQSKESNNPS